MVGLLSVKVVLFPVELMCQEQYGTIVCLSTCLSVLKYLTSPRYFDDSGNEVCTKSFPLSPTCSYQPATKPGSMELGRDRGTKLGTNMSHRTSRYQAKIEQSLNCRYLVSPAEPLTSPGEPRPVDKEGDIKPLSPTLVC